ncbi:hypothetical protein KFK09_001070 [Dendrobium nobile]|uniref:Uncharacterized protein n=1 Tax=Dendrobium nobile TaxID=94219 RepID=A0A8T3C6C6_DENNO|nr:hypothetical protein KFK09_001070 [Dendrobium nobile]
MYKLIPACIPPAVEYLIDASSLPYYSFTLLKHRISVVACVRLVDRFHYFKTAALGSLNCLQCFIDDKLNKMLKTALEEDSILVMLKAALEEDSILVMLKAALEEDSISNLASDEKLNKMLGELDALEPILLGCFLCAKAIGLIPMIDQILKKEIGMLELQWYGFCMFKALASLHKQGVGHAISN